MKIVRGREASGTSVRRTEKVTGVSWADPVLASDGALGGTAEVTISHVFFEPAARTHWHTHERGQILHVTSGQGRVFTRSGTGGIIAVGDTVFIEPGEEHWHGADSGAYLVHVAISLGDAEWLGEVSDEEYGLAG